jgi:hypothetical protein
MSFRLRGFVLPQRKHAPRRLARGPGWRKFFRPRFEPLEDRTLPSTLNWINPAGGDWDTAGNWDANRVPNGTDDAVININTTNPITHSGSQSDAVNTLTSTSQAAIAISTGALSITNAASINGNLTLSGATLISSGTLQVNGTFLISGGTLANANVLSGTTITGTTAGGTLNGVTLNGNLDLTGANGVNLTVVNGLTLDGTATLGQGGNYGYLTFGNSQTLAGTGTVVFAGSNGSDALYTPSGSTTLTIASTISVHGQSGYVGAGPRGRRRGQPGDGQAFAVGPVGHAVNAFVVTLHDFPIAPRRHDARGAGPDHSHPSLGRFDRGRSGGHQCHAGRAPGRRCCPVRGQ